jgi:hypothetical protein
MGSVGRVVGVRSRRLKRRSIAVEYVEVPTHQEEPWERDRRAIEDRERRRLRSSDVVESRRDEPWERYRGSAASRFELSAGGRSKAVHASAGWSRPRLVVAPGEWWFVVLVVVFGVGLTIAALLARHSV